MYQGSPLFPIFRELSRSLHRYSSVSIQPNHTIHPVYMKYNKIQLPKYKMDFNIIIIIVRILPPWQYLNDSTVNFCKPRGPQYTYYYIVVIIVAGKKMQEREIKYTFN